MPTAPKRPCAKCRRVKCVCPPGETSGWHRGTTPTRERRPGWERTRARRAQVVAAWRAQFGDYCPQCGRTGVKLTCDHIVPIALGGQEDGELGVLCVECHRKQASAVAHEVKRRKQREQR